MNLAARILKLFGWTLSVTVPDYPKCLICVAPHTSNWDFIIGKLAYAAIGRKAGFLMKETWFFPPLGWFFRAIGGIPVPRRRGASLSQVIIDRFNRADRMTLAVTPEGTRSRVDRWRTGFLHIAYDARIPIVLGVLDFNKRHISLDRTFEPTEDIDRDMREIKKYYRDSGAMGRHPEKFSTSDD